MTLVASSKSQAMVQTHWKLTAVALASVMVDSCGIYYYYFLYIFWQEIFVYGINIFLYKARTLSRGCSRLVNMCFLSSHVHFFIFSSQEFILYILELYEWLMTCKSFWKWGTDVALFLMPSVYNKKVLFEHVKVSNVSFHSENIYFCKTCDSWMHFQCNTNLMKLQNWQKKLWNLTVVKLNTSVP